MTSELEGQIRDDAEANRDTSPPGDAFGTRPNLNRSTVYSVRLTVDEVAAVHAVANQVGLPASTLVRSWIVERLNSANPSAAGATLRALIHQEVYAAVHEALAS